MNEQTTKGAVVKMYDYDMMTNEELVVLVRSRDSRAFEMLEHRFSRFILLKARAKHGKNS